MKSLLLTLGHNSSAIFVPENGGTPIGYEQERLSGIKSDSQFPNDAIAEIIRNVGINEVKGCKIYISTWFDFIDNVVPNKYITQIDLDNLKSISKNIVFVNEKFTHHDAHAYSGLEFFKWHYFKQNKNFTKTDKVNIIVADGFGNNGEVLSIYTIDSFNAKGKASLPKLSHRVYGYKNSIGLMYQYATSYVGMKENQDEYKFLGYEAHIDEYLDKKQINMLNDFIGELTDTLWKGFLNSTDPKNYKTCEYIINFDLLKDTKEYFYNIFKNAYNLVWKNENREKYSKEENEFIQRCIVAYHLQQTVENFFKRVIKHFDMHNVIVCGGSFYNVKLNNCVFSNIDGYFCAMPLAGDQGAAIGMYAYYEKEQFNFDTLCIGKRNFYGAEKVFKKSFYYEATDELAKEIARKIADGNIVNLVHGNIEFGPRALMHTSSLFIPTVENTAQNNSNNLRNEVMPCAPVCTKENAEFLFGKEDIDRVVGSDGFMILTHVYQRGFSELYGGVMHKIVLQDGYSGRPQIVEPDTFEYKILVYLQELTDIRCIVNTSFNKHGTPILFSMKQIKDDHNFQVEHSKINGYKKVPLLYVIEK